MTPSSRILRAVSFGLACCWCSLAQAAVFVTPILAQEEEEPERAYSLEVALIMLCIILGLLVTLRPSSRTSEIKKPKAAED